MNKITYYVLGFILCFVRPAWANPLEAAAGSPAWILTLETIKVKAKELMARNTELSAEYNTLAQDINNLNTAIDTQNAKNAALASFLKDRHGRSDQQARIEELEAQLKEQKARLGDRQKEHDGLKGEAASLERKVKSKQARVTDWELRQNTQQPSAGAPQMSAVDVELDGLRKQLEAEKSKEVHLEDELAHPNDRPTIPAPPVIVQASVVNHVPRPQDKARIARALRKKEELETKIRDIDARLRQMQTFGGEGMEKKKIIRDIVQVDARNQGLRANAARLHEDIGLLADQIEKLERRSGLIEQKGKR